MCQLLIQYVYGQVNISHFTTYTSFGYVYTTMHRKSNCINCLGNIYWYHKDITCKLNNYLGQRSMHFYNGKSGGPMCIRTLL